MVVSGGERSNERAKAGFEVSYWSDFGFWDERRKELLREAEEGRLARDVRAAERAEGETTDGASRSDDLVVRWGLHKDDALVADLFELNGLPRWAAFEERFVVVEENGGIVAAVRYRVEKGRLVLGVFVADPWAGERRVAGALYSGVRDLAREVCAREVWATDDRFADYPREVGYVKRRGVWTLDTEPGSNGSRRARFRGLMALLGSGAAPFFRAFTR